MEIERILQVGNSSEMFFRFWIMVEKNRRLGVASDVKIAIKKILG